MYMDLQVAVPVERNTIQTSDKIEEKKNNLVTQATYSFCLAQK